MMEKRKASSNTNGNNDESNLTDYERQRLRRIAENKARLESLGLSKISNSLISSVQKDLKNVSKCKKKFVDDDEYVPPNEADTSDSTSMDEENDNDDDDEDVLKNLRKKGKSKSQGFRSKVPNRVVDEEDDDILRAISLSLQEVAHGSEHMADGSFNGKRFHPSDVVDASSRTKKKKHCRGSIKMSEDDLILNFFQFDEVGEGSITARDVLRVAKAHDFTWKEEEVAEMIRCFDSSGTGKLQLEDFRKVVERCNMLMVT